MYGVRRLAMAETWAACAGLPVSVVAPPAPVELIVSPAKSNNDFTATSNNNSSSNRIILNNPVEQ